MSIFEKASRMKLKFSSNVGRITTEDLWDLSLSNLDTMAIALNEKLERTPKKSYVDEETAQDKVTKLKFDIVLHIITVKKEERKASKDLAAKKVEREKILAVLAKKKEESLEGLSEEELMKKLEEL